MQEKNIYPVFDRALTRDDKQKFLNQHSRVLWFTGLSGAGKSTLSIAIEKELFNKGFVCQLLDGDNIRSGINNNLGFSIRDRKENIRRIAEVAKLFKDSGIIILAAFVSPTRNIRNMAREIIGTEDFLEIFVNPPLAICEERDTKGLYKKARLGIIKNFTGISSPFEHPEQPLVNIDTSKYNVEESVQQILDRVMPLITMK
ncbi:MAG: adenylyl-sulfate kinase [Bacteroidales bacterium]|nr:adenylyl-sulfate kinase [Bacteroidales bacterium]MDD3011709.1 adenylyl-sulfate kinase [Bacteroidales bacterium]MDD3962189.1 adenylyl-sulfate kinase [Bacteroidales bacterium]MDY0284721.1 adenylyl-sulfate kinase [Bacteroidales bacterium]HPE86933.1 adenylyl-sulfate kinase [Bacteroidales bacterium]